MNIELWNYGKANCWKMLKANYFLSYSIWIIIVHIHMVLFIMRTCSKSAQIRWQTIFKLHYHWNQFFCGRQLLYVSTSLQLISGLINRIVSKRSYSVQMRTITYTTEWLHFLWLFLLYLYFIIKNVNNN